MATQLINKRIKALRENLMLTQDDLAKILGFNDRQTISAIETGARRVSAEELLLLAEKLDAPLEYFTDSFLLTGEARFSWRQTEATATQLKAYEKRAGRWIAAFRTLAPQVGHELPLMRGSLSLTRYSRFEEAMMAGERFSVMFELGKVPANRLVEIMERELSILVLMVDTCSGISGAACRLPELDTVLINRQEVTGHRHFDLAHELFHILTWDAMPPNHTEDALEIGGSRVEKLANNFAGAVLMPATCLERFGNWSHDKGDTLIRRLNAVADELQVTASALKWRLVSLGLLSRAVARELPVAALHHNGHSKVQNTAPALFSKSFMEVIASSIENGLVSVRRVAKLLDLNIDDLSDLFAEHDVAYSIEL